MTRTPAARPHALARRLRLIGALVLTIGLFGAGLTYWVETYHHEATAEDVLPGYAQANRRQMGLLYGSGGATIFEWLRDLAQPGAQAFFIAALAAIVANGCFRAARFEGERAADRDSPTDA